MELRRQIVTAFLITIVEVTVMTQLLSANLTLKPDFKHSLDAEIVRGFGIKLFDFSIVLHLRTY